MHALISLSGILIMWGVAWVISWYKHLADKMRCENQSAGRQCRSGGRGLMKATVLLSLVLLCGCLAALPGGCPGRRCAERCPGRAPACEVPSYLLTTESQLPKVAEAIKAGKPLEHPRDGQPFLDHDPGLGRQLLSGAHAGRPEGKAAAVGAGAVYP